MNRDDHNWDTCEAELWLTNTEHSYHAMAGIVWGADDATVAGDLRELFQQVYEIFPPAVDVNSVDWLAIAANQRAGAEA